MHAWMMDADPAAPAMHDGDQLVLVRSSLCWCKCATVFTPTPASNMHGLAAWPPRKLMFIHSDPRPAGTPAIDRSSCCHLTANNAKRLLCMLLLLLVLLLVLVHAES